MWDTDADTVEEDTRTILAGHSGDRDRKRDFLFLAGLFFEGQVEAKAVEERLIPVLQEAIKRYSSRAVRDSSRCPRGEGS